MAGRDSYHHGNLREALIAASVDLIAEKGPLGFSLTEAARKAGVSAAAPYRHFEGRDALLEEVARQGFLDFAARLEAAYDDMRGGPLAAFSRLGLAYLAFAQDQPGHYMAMFEAGLPMAGRPDLARAADRARAVLLRGAEALRAVAPPSAGPPPPAGMIADHIWALSHGVVEIFARARPGTRSPIPPADMLESGVLIYLRGLGLMA